MWLNFRRNTQSDFLGLLTFIWCGINVKEDIPISEYYFVLKSFHGPATISKLQGLNVKILLSFWESQGLSRFEKEWERVKMKPVASIISS